MRTANVLYVYDYSEHSIETYTNLRIDRVTYNQYTRQSEDHWFARDVATMNRFEIDYLPNKVFDNCIGKYTLWMDDYDKTKAYELFVDYFTKTIQSDIDRCKKQIARCEKKFDDIVNADLPNYFKMGLRFSLK